MVFTEPGTCSKVKFAAAKVFDREKFDKKAGIGSLPISSKHTKLEQ